MFRGLAVGIIALVMTTSVGADEPEPTLIRVLVADRVEAPTVEVTGRYRVMNVQTRKYISWGLLGKCYSMQPLETGLRWGEQFPGVYQLAIQPSDGRASVLVNGVQYRGTVLVYQVGDRISVVNEVPIDYYCKVVLADQFREPQSAEVMSALAIVARTNACWLAKRHSGTHFDVRADEVDYRGHSVTLAAPDVVAAVDDSRYMVMEQGACPGQSFPAVWTADCGGATAPYQAVFRTPDYAGRGVPAPLAAHNRANSAWHVAVPKAWLAEAADIDTITRLNLYTDGPSKKVYAVRLASDQHSVDLDFTALQEVVGAERLLSNDFTATIEGNEVVFRGYGKGHGVGLCLFSAEKLAARGNNASAILEEFFPDASLRILEPQPKKKSLMSRIFPGHTTDPRLAAR